MGVVPERRVSRRRAGEAQRGDREHESATAFAARRLGLRRLLPPDVDTCDVHASLKVEWWLVTHFNRSLSLGRNRSRSCLLTL
eukprot:5841046-Prymnesium_polylepis.2